MRCLPQKVAVLAAAILIGTTALASGASGASTSGPRRGGSFVALGNSFLWPSLDPAGVGSQPKSGTTVFSPIYGQLFKIGPTNTIVPNMACSWKYSDKNLQLDITICKGIQFSDGTPYTAQAVASSINRDLQPAAACVCDALFADVTSVTAPSKYDVRLMLSTPDSGIIPSFVGEAPNYTVDPTALASMGEPAYAQDPVGAGPFKVVSNEASVKIVLVRNAKYFDSPEPYLNSLTIESTGSDQSDISALESGQAQLTGVTTASLFTAAASLGLKTQRQLPTTLAFVKLNTQAAPFNNPIAREAVAYATNAKSIVANLYANLYTTIEGYTSPGLFYYEKTVPGFPAYNLSKAQQLVSEIPGGLSFTLDTTSNTTAQQTEASALAAMYDAAGMHVTVQVNTLSTTISVTEAGKWQAFDAAWVCGIDPSTCDTTNLASNGLFSGIRDPKLDGLINQFAAFVNPTTRQHIYDEINQLVDANYYIVPMYATGALLVFTKNVHGLTHYPTSGIGYDDWETVWLS